jgi:hypothetical protein
MNINFITNWVKEEKEKEEHDFFILYLYLKFLCKNIGINSLYSKKSLKVVS